MSTVCDLMMTIMTWGKSKSR